MIASSSLHIVSSVVLLDHSVLACHKLTSVFSVGTKYIVVVVAVVGRAGVVVAVDVAIGDAMLPFACREPTTL